MNKNDISSLNSHLEKVVEARNKRASNTKTPNDACMSSQIPQSFYEMQQDLHLAEAIEISKRMTTKSVKKD